jgi:hypothetical protein
MRVVAASLARIPAPVGRPPPLVGVRPADGDLAAEKRYGAFKVAAVSLQLGHGQRIQWGCLGCPAGVISVIPSGGGRVSASMAGVVQIIDEVCGARRGDAGASTRTYLALAALNRVVAPCSKPDSRTGGRGRRHRGSRRSPRRSWTTGGSGTRCTSLRWRTWTDQPADRAADRGRGWAGLFISRPRHDELFSDLRPLPICPFLATIMRTARANARGQADAQHGAALGRVHARRDG